MEELLLIGNLGNDPDVRYTNGGEKVVSFSLAVQAGKNAQGETMAHWYTCDAWERLAYICEQYLLKGSKVFVRGVPRAEAYQSKRDGKPRAALKVTVHKLEMLGSRQEEQAHGAGRADGAGSPEGAGSSGYTQVEPDELPF